MSTSIDGLHYNLRNNSPIVGVNVTAVSVDGYSEGSATTDANGRFTITGLTDRDWLAAATVQPDELGVFYLIPNPVAHIDLSSVTADQHHEGFVGFLDNSLRLVNPDSNDRIQITDDGAVNADLGGEGGGVLSLSIDPLQIDHGEIGGTFDDDHPTYLAMVGRSGGQELHGGTASGDNLTLRSTTNETPGKVNIGSSSLFSFDEAVGQLRLPTAGSSAGLLLGGSALWYRSIANTMRTPDNLRVDGTSIFTGNVTIQSNAQLDVLKTGSAGGILIGADAQWYRDSANVMRTPDALTVDGLLTSSGGITGSGVNDFGGATSFEIPNSATPTVNADGEIALDTTITDFSHGLVRYFGGEELVLIAVPAAAIDTAPTDGFALAYNATNDEFEFVDGTGHGTTTTISNHSDVGAITEARGMVFYVNSSTEWAGLAAETAGALLGGDGTDLVSTVPKRTITLTASGGHPTTTAGCATAVRVEAGTNDVDYWVLDFDDGADEFAFWGPIAMPANYDGGVMTAIFYWTTTATDTDGVAWAIQLLSLDDNDAIDSAWGTAVVVTDDAQSAAGEMLITAATGNITPGGTAVTPETLFVRVFRDVSDANDDMTEDARLMMVKLLYTVDGISD